VRWATRVVTVNDILDGHVGLDLECFDRIYLNGWVPNLQVSGPVVNFLTHHLGFPIPSPAILEKIGLRFRKAVTEFAAGNDIEVIRFAKGERKLEVMRPYLDRLAREGRTGVASVGVAQEFARVFTGTTYHPDAEGGGLPRFGYHKADRRVTAYYFYLVDEVFGPARFVSRPSSTTPPTSGWRGGSSTCQKSCRKPVTSTVAWSMLSVSARAVSLRAQPLSGSRDQPLRMVGGPQPCASATLGSWPWPARCARACTSLPGSPTGACAPG